MRLWVEMQKESGRRHPDPVSLLVRLWVEITHTHTRQPPCEAVSWNSAVIGGFTGFLVSLLVRLWVEMSTNIWLDLLNPVSLLVRLWVEIMLYMSIALPSLVSLLVRLWVEMLMGLHDLLLNLSASLWGCELKWQQRMGWKACTCQPPCEAVSWNAYATCPIMENSVSLLVRLWVEMMP